MEIPFQNIDKAILRELLKEVVTRDGTDYGAEEKSVEAKITSAILSLEQGKARLYWNAESETASLHSANSKPE